jgi:hypothetical protein
LLPWTAQETKMLWNVMHLGLSGGEAAIAKCAWATSDGVKFISWKTRGPQGRVRQSKDKALEAELVDTVIEGTL